MINAHPGVQMSLVRARRSPITGAVVVADVVPTSADGRGAEAVEERDSRGLPPRVAAPQGAGRDPLRAVARCHRRRQAGAPRCVTSSSPAAAAASASPSRRKLQAAGYRVIAVARHQSETWRDARDAAARLPAPSISPISPASAPGARAYARSSGRSTGSSTTPPSAPAACSPRCAMREIERLVRLNTLSPIILTKYVVRSMMARRAAAASSTSPRSSPSPAISGLSAYSATKASLIGFTRSLAREVGRCGITVNAVAPGFVDTEMTARPRRDEHARRSSGAAPCTGSPRPRTSPTRSSFCSSDKAKNITGTVMTVDAGSTA